MTRRVNFTRYKKEHEDAFRRSWFRWQARRPAGAPPLVRTRPRDPAEIKLLDQLAYDAWHGAIERGDLERVGPRRYRVRVHGL